MSTKYIPKKKKETLIKIVNINFGDGVNWKCEINESNIYPTQIRATQKNEVMYFNSGSTYSRDIIYRGFHYALGGIDFQLKPDGKLHVNSGIRKESQGEWY